MIDEESGFPSVSSFGGSLEVDPVKMLSLWFANPFPLFCDSCFFGELLQAPTYP